MAAGDGTGPDRLVLFSLEADLDLASIHTYTSRVWNFHQANLYLQFLLDETKSLAQSERQGKAVPRRPGRYYISVKWHNARNSHRIIYEDIPQGIFIVRVLHSSMLLLKHIPLRRLE